MTRSHAVMKIVAGAAIVLVTAALASAQTTAKAPAAAKSQTEAQAVDNRDVNLRAYVELLRSDVRSQKVAILTQVMEFTEAEDAKFWPIYREYDVELSALNDERIGLIKEYAKNYDAMTNEAADRIASAVLGLEGKRHALKQKYYERIKTTLSPLKAAKFLQVENQLLMIIDLQIAAALPVVRESGPQR